MANGSREKDSITGEQEEGESAANRDIEEENERELEKSFVPCSKCCPQVNQTVVLVALAWILVSVLLSLVNQFIFHHHLKFAFFLILIGLLSTFLGSVLCFVATSRKIDLAQVSKYWRILLLFSFLHALGLSFNNLSSQVSGLTLNQIVRSALPLATLVASWYFEGKNFSKGMVLITSFLVVSASLAIFKNPEFSAVGFLCALGALICQTLETIVVSLLLRKTSFSVIDIALTTSIPSAAMVVIPFYIFEFDGVVANATQNKTFVVGFLIASSILAFLSYVIHFQLIWYTSSHYSVVVGHLKIVLLLMSSVVVFGTPLVTINYVGIALVVLGFVALNAVKLAELRNKAIPILTYSELPALTLEMLESKDKTFSQPRDD